MKMIPLIIDCDPGMDDAFALFYALGNPRFDVKLITTVSGNVSVDKTTRNAQEIIRLSGRTVRLARGAEKPLIAKPVFAEDVHGVNGLGAYLFEPYEGQPIDDQEAVDAMIDVLEHTKDKVTLVAIGPLTNVAKLLIRYPYAKEKISCISIMGGGLKGGNTTIAAEFNIYVDPEAARIVFESGIDIIMAGLDVTEKSYIEKSDFEVIGRFGAVGSMLETMLMKRTVSNLHDLVSLVVLEKPDIFDGEKLHVCVETGGVYTRGMTVADVRQHNRSGHKNVFVLKDLDRNEFKDELFRVLGSYS